MNNGNSDAVFEDETWGGENSSMGLTDCSDETDQSDFTPGELALMRRKRSTKTAPLPKGVDDVKWQPPVATGLDNSTAIFQTKDDGRGMLTLSSEGISENNNHFRRWQEDNGIAKSFASRTVEKEVDGKRITVAVAKKPSTLANRLVRANTGAATTTRRPSSAGAVLQAVPIPSSSPVPDVQYLRSLSKRLPVEECGCDDQENDANVGSSTARRSSGQSLPSSVEVPNQQVSGTSQGLPLLSTVASDRVVPTMPHRPYNGAPSSHARESSNGRSLSEKGVVGREGVSPLPEQSDGTEVVRHPSPAGASGGVCQRVDDLNENGVGHPSSGTPTKTVGDSEGGRIQVTSGRRGQQCQDADEKGLCNNGNEPPTSTPSPQGTARKTWWGGWRGPTAMRSPQPPRRRGKRFNFRLPGRRPRNVTLP